MTYILLLVGVMVVMVLMVVMVEVPAEGNKWLACVRVMMLLRFNRLILIKIIQDSDFI